MVLTTGTLYGNNRIIDALETLKHAVERIYALIRLRVYYIKSYTKHRKEKVKKNEDAAS